MSTLDTNQLDRAAGALLGTAIGDALLASYEFGTDSTGGNTRPARGTGQPPHSARVTRQTTSMPTSAGG